MLFDATGIEWPLSVTFAAKEIAMKFRVISAFSIGLLAGIPAFSAMADDHATQIAKNDQSKGDKGTNTTTGQQDTGRGNKGSSGRGGQHGNQGAGPTGQFHGNTSTTIVPTDHKVLRGNRGAGPTGQFHGNTSTTVVPTDHKVLRGNQSVAPTGRTLGGTVFGARPQNWNRYPRQFDRNVYQRNYTSPQHFHWRTYNRPSGWYYQRWVFGQILPRIFWAQDYWLTDYWMFGLPVPPYGYEWVRYGDDALLINIRTGEVLQVVYGLFD